MTENESPENKSFLLQVSLAKASMNTITTLAITVSDKEMNDRSIVLLLLDTFEPSLLDMEPLLDPLDDITMSSALNDDYTNQSTLSYLMSSQSRRLSTGKNIVSLAYRV